MDALCGFVQCQPEMRGEAVPGDPGDSGPDPPPRSEQGRSGLETAVC